MTYNETMYPYPCIHIIAEFHGFVLTIGLGPVRPGNSHCTEARQRNAAAANVAKNYGG